MKRKGWVRLGIIIGVLIVLLVLIGPAAELMVETINASSRPVMVFVSGNHTNLAEALRLDLDPEQMRALAAAILGH